MKLDEVLELQQLDELSLKQAIAAGVATGAMMSPIKHGADTLQYKDPPKIVQQEQPSALATQIAKKYKVNPSFAEQVVQLAHKYEKATFPKARDILALVGVESSFNPAAVSGLKSDPAVGLMQVRPGVWNVNRDELSGSIENQIKMGSNVLHNYYTKLKDKNSAVQAYNVGLTNFRQGYDNPDYLNKYHQELLQYAKI